MDLGERNDRFSFTTHTKKITTNNSIQTGYIISLHTTSECTYSYYDTLFVVTAAPPPLPSSMKRTQPHDNDVDWNDNDADDPDDDDDDEEEEDDAGNGMMADSDEDSAFKTAVGTSRFEDGSFYTARRFYSRAASIMTLDDSFLDAREDLSPDKNYPSKITAAELRLQPILMSVISTSQERCRNLWKGDLEPHRNNVLFQSILKRAKHNNQTIKWESSSTDLFDLLAAWREDVAEQLECLPGFVAPLDFLVAVAWKRPTTEHGLRRINWQLPPVLDQFPEYRQQLLDRVLEFSLSDGSSSPTATVAFYSNLNLAADFGDTDKRRGLGALSSSISNMLSWDTALTVLVAGLLVEGFVRVVMDVRRKHR